jgi:putative ABC transport system ATP-binding protein
MITLSSIVKYFHKGSINEILAIDNISLRVDEGDFITIIGSNGAGKSTLLNCIAGTYPIESGTIEVSNQTITQWPEFRRAKLIARVFQDPLMGTCAHASIEQNLALANKRGQNRGLGFGVKSKDRSFFKQELKHLGLGLENRLLDTAGLLSGGQRQALTMLMATLVKPEILLLDEHLAALDPKTAQQVLELTQNIVKQKKLTTLMVTHQMKHAIQLGNRLIMLHRGKIIFDVRNEEKSKLTVKDLLSKFYEAQGEELANDKMLLT